MAVALFEIDVCVSAPYVRLVADAWLLPSSNLQLKIKRVFFSRWYCSTYMSF